MSEDIAGLLLEHAGIESDEAEEMRQRIADGVATVSSVQDATSSEGSICKRDGCPNEWVDQRGPYAKLCNPHREEAKRARQNARGAEVAVKPPRSASPGQNAADLVKLVDALKSPAKRFQKALAAKKATKDEAVAALEEFRDALKAIQSAAQSAIEEAR